LLFARADSILSPVHRIAFELGPLTVSWYGIFVAAGFSAHGIAGAGGAALVTLGIAELGFPIAQRIVDPVDGGVGGEPGVDGATGAN